MLNAARSQSCPDLWASDTAPRARVGSGGFLAPGFLLGLTALIRPEYLGVRGRVVVDRGGSPLGRPASGCRAEAGRSGDCGGSRS